MPFCAPPTDRTQAIVSVQIGGTVRAEGLRGAIGVPSGQLVADSRLRLWAVNPGHPAARGQRIPGPSVTERFCAQDESARNAGGTPGCGTADGAARRTRGTQTGSPPVPAGRGCRRPACGAPAEWEASAALAVPVRTRNACTRVRTHRTGSLAPRPVPCRAVAARAAGCSMRSCVHGRAAVSPGWYYEMTRTSGPEHPTQHWLG
jgi:hypothetical protein